MLALIYFERLFWLVVSVRVLFLHVLTLNQNDVLLLYLRSMQQMSCSKISNVLLLDLFKSTWIQNVSNIYLVNARSWSYFERFIWACYSKRKKNAFFWLYFLKTPLGLTLLSTAICQPFCLTETTFHNVISIKSFGLRFLSVKISLFPCKCIILQK